MFIIEKIISIISNSSSNSTVKQTQQHQSRKEEKAFILLVNIKLSINDNN